MYKRQIYQIAESNRIFLSELECSTQHPQLAMHVALLRQFIRGPRHSSSRYTYGELT